MCKYKGNEERRVKGKIQNAKEPRFCPKERRLVLNTLCLAPKSLGSISNQFGSVDVEMAFFLEKATNSPIGHNMKL